MRFLLAILFAVCCVTGAHAADLPILINLHHGTGGGGAPTAFTPLHTYFMSATGSDSNSGTDAAHPWASANHAVVCGDVIIAATGTYTNGIYTNTQPTGCPSTTGGIDGNGGINFAVVLCGGADLEACQVNCTGSCGGANNSNPTALFVDEVCCWAFEGFKVQGGGANSTGDSFQARFCNAANHHVALINSISWNSASAFGINSCSDVNGNHGGDYFFTVGLIAQQSNYHPVCLAAVDAVNTYPWDTNAGTHILFYGDFAIKNDGNTDCTGPTNPWPGGGPNDVDVEGMMCDTCGLNNYGQQVVFTNNIIYLSHRMGLHATNSSGGGAPHIIWYNTLFANNDGPSWSNNSGGGVIGDMQIENSWFYQIWNNIVKTNWAVTPNGPSACCGTVTGYGRIYALYVNGPPLANTTIGAQMGAGLENVFLGMQTGCSGPTGGCDAGNNAAYDSGGSLGTNTYADPGFTNTTDLLNNQTGVPNCAGFVSTTACMGWNANTSTLTTPSVISDLMPSNTYAAKGFQLPSTTCASGGNLVTYWPASLKGIVYLHWTGTAVVQNHDLATTPCGQ